MTGTAVLARPFGELTIISSPRQRARVALTMMTEPHSGRSSPTTRSGSVASLVSIITLPRGSMSLARMFPRRTRTEARCRPPSAARAGPRSRCRTDRPPAARRSRAPFRARSPRASSRARPGWSRARSAYPRAGRIARDRPVLARDHLRPGLGLAVGQGRFAPSTGRAKRPRQDLSLERIDARGYRRATATPEIASPSLNSMVSPAAGSPALAPSGCAAAARPAAPHRRRSPTTSSQPAPNVAMHVPPGVEPSRKARQYDEPIRRMHGPPRRRRAACTLAACRAKPSSAHDPRSAAELVPRRTRAMPARSRLSISDTATGSPASPGGMRRRRPTARRTPKTSRRGFLALLRRFPGFRLTSRLTTYLYPITKNAAARRARRREVETRLNPNAARPEGAPSTFRGPVARAATSRIVPRGSKPLLDRLPPGQREALLMRAVDEMTLEEIGLALAIPVGTVKSRLHAAAQALRGDPAARGYFDEPA